MKVYMKKGINTPVEITDLVISIRASSSFQEDRLLGNAPSVMVDLDLNNISGVLSNCAGNTFLIDLHEADLNGIPKQEFIVQDAPERYTKKLSLNLYDVMIKFNQPYKSTLTYKKDMYPTISKQLDEMAALTGINIDKSGLSSLVLNKQAQWIDTTILMREYIGWIAELSGTNAYINSDNKLAFRKLFTANHEIDFTSDFDKTEQITLSRVAYDDGVNLIASGDNSGKTLYIDANNSYCDSQTYTDAILAKYKGQTFYGVSGLKTFGKDTVHLSDTVTYDGYKCIVLSIKRKYAGMQSVVELDGRVALKNVDSVVTKIDDTVRIKRVLTTVDQVESKLQIVAQDIESSNRKISAIEVKADSITQTVNDMTEKYATKAELEQTSNSISATVTQELDGKLNKFGPYLEHDAIHFKRTDGTITKKEVSINEEKIEFIRSDGSSAIKITDNESYMDYLKVGEWFTIGGGRQQSYPMIEWDGSTTQDAWSLFYSAGGNSTGGR